MNLETLGFSREHETDKAVCWSCPQGKFWLPKRPIRPFPSINLGNLANIAAAVATEINASWVAVNILERTEGGAARIAFPAARMLAEEERQDRMHQGGIKGALSKRADMHVPAAWLLEIGGKWVAPLQKLSDKLNSRREYARKQRRQAYNWRPDAGGIASAAEVLAWLQEVNVEALNVVAKAMERERLAQFNSKVDQQFNTLLEKQYGAAARAYRKTARGKAADIPDPYRFQDVVLVKAALKQDGFIEWARKWKTKQEEKLREKQQ